VIAPALSFSRPSFHARWLYSMMLTTGNAFLSPQNVGKKYLAVREA
jgi:hypothetical protein